MFPRNCKSRAGRRDGKSFGRWSRRSRSTSRRFASCIGSVRPLLSEAPNKVVCNIVGGVISPLLANIYLHWFEKQHGRRDGPGTWANSKLVRYADDFVVLARYQSPQLVNWIERLLEGRFRLTINREKTRIVKMRQPGESLTFLGFTLRYDRDLHGRDHRYLNVIPSAKALARAREKIRDMTGPQRCCVPIPAVDPRDQPLDDELESVLPLRLSPFGVPPAELVCRRTIESSPATSESTPLPNRGRQDSLCQAATPRPAAFVTVLRLTPCECLGAR